MACNSSGFEYVVSFLDFKPDSGKVLNGDHFAFITKPIPCPRDWGLCSFEDLSIYIVPCVPLIADRDGIFGSWLNSEWAFNCCKFRREGEVRIKSVQPPVSSFGRGDQCHSTRSMSFSF